MKNTRLEQLGEFLKNQPGDPFLKYAIATEYLKLGETDSALVFFKQLIEDHAGYLGTYYHLGKLYEQLGSNTEAEETYRQGIAIAKKQGNQHALSELMGAYNLIKGIEEDDE